MEATDGKAHHRVSTGRRPKVVQSVPEVRHERQLMWLDDPGAPDVARVGSEALLRARAAGLPVVDGFVITTNAAMLMPS